MVRKVSFDLQMNTEIFNIFFHAMFKKSIAHEAWRRAFLTRSVQCAIIIYILYFPKSSGERFSRNSLNFSFLKLSRSVIFVPNSISLDLLITFSSTKIGELDRKAMAIASLGRASIMKVLPSLCR